MRLLPLMILQKMHAAEDIVVLVKWIVGWLVRVWLVNEDDAASLCFESEVGLTEGHVG